MHTLTFVSPHRRVDAADGALEVSRAALEASRDALQGAEASAGRGQEAARADEARDAHERSILALELASLLAVCCSVQWVVFLLIMGLSLRFCALRTRCGQGRNKKQAEEGGCVDSYVTGTF